jgi:hypothetical protein
VTVAGSGFGAAQGFGQVWLGTVPGVVQSWSDAQVVAVVGAGSATGYARVLQNGVMSNAVPFTVNSLQLTSVSPNSGVAGTSVTLTGAGFGASQGTGIAWLGSMAGQVVSWSDTQVVATVAPGALSGMARIQQNGVWSNAVVFTVPGSDGSILRLVPNPINLEVGDTQMIQALNGAGQPVTGLTWTSSDPTVVSLSTDDPPVLTAVAAGQVTITAGTATANVTVWATTPPVGTVLWSNPGDGSGVTSIVPAVPSGYGVADVFAFQGDGTTAWTAVVPSMGAPVVPRMGPTAPRRMMPAGRYRPTAEQDQQPAARVVPDFQGGLVMMTSNSIVGLDGMTGQPKFTYTLQNLGQCPGFLPDSYTFLAVHPDGTIFTLGCDGYNPTIVGIDGASGAQRFSAPLTLAADGYHQGPWDWYGMMIAGDGYAYAAYGYADNYQGGSPCTGMDSHLRLLRVDSSGNYDNIDVVDVQTPDCDGDGWLPFGVSSMITNADQGIMFTWGDWYGNSFIATTTGASASVMSAPPGRAPDPVLQAQDGSFIGITWTGNEPYEQNMVSFDASGNLLWTMPGNWQPQIATADGGVIATDQDTGAAIKFDRNGAAKWQLSNSGAVNAWDDAWYVASGGTAAEVEWPEVHPATSWAAFEGGSPSPNGAYVGVALSHLEDLRLFALPVRGPKCEIANVGPHHVPGVKTPLTPLQYLTYAAIVSA